MLAVEIITPDGILATTTGDEVIVSTSAGVIGVRSGHLPLIAPLKAGELVVKNDGKNEEQSFVVTGGFVEILDDSIHVLADTAEREEDLNEMLIKQAIERAEKLKLDATDQHQFERAVALLEMNLAKLKIAQRKNRRGH